MDRRVRLRRSLVKAITYRVVIMALDFATIYLFTGRVSVAAGFMVASNVYTTLAYLVHERLWAQVSWGLAGVGSARGRDESRPLDG
jgi:uncharacterized membrane protein